jgi:hypothetical protein
MEKIIKNDYIELNNMKKLTSIAKYQDTILISSKDSINKLISYKITNTFDFTDYKNINYPSDILSISSNNDINLLILKDNKIFVFDINSGKEKLLDSYYHQFFDIYQSALVEISKHTDTYHNISYKLIYMITHNKYLYLFIQSYHDNKVCNLYILNVLLHYNNLTHSTHLHDNIMFKQKIKVSKQFKYYKNINFKNASFKDDNLIMLFTYGKHNKYGILFKIKIYENLNSLNKMKKIKNICINNNPIGITYLNNNHFMIIGEKHKIIDNKKLFNYLIINLLL